MRLSKFLMLLLITALTISVTQARVPIIKKNTVYSSVSKVQVDNVIVINSITLFNQVDEGVLQENTFYRFYKLNKSDVAELPLSYIVLPDKKVYVERSALLSPTRSFTNYNRLKRLEIILIPPNSGS